MSFSLLCFRIAFRSFNYFICVIYLCINNTSNGVRGSVITESHNWKIVLLLSLRCKHTDRLDRQWIKKMKNGYLFVYTIFLDRMYYLSKWFNCRDKHAAFCIIASVTYVCQKLFIRFFLSKQNCCALLTLNCCHDQHNTCFVNLALSTNVQIGVLIHFKAIRVHTNLLFFGEILDIK